MMYPKLKHYISSLERLFHTISEERQLLLNAVLKNLQSAEQLRLNFICTHNSRRSHLSQVWAQTAADHYGISVQTFSGGTEATAFHPNAIEALKRAGFHIHSPGGENPHYEIWTAPERSPMICFSKRFDDEINPKSDFIALMTCSEADQACPVVSGATKKIQLLYEDPKVADKTPLEATTYDERSKQIATEMLYLFSQMK